MQKERALEFLAFQLELPSKQARYCGGDRRGGSQQEIVVARVQQAATRFPLANPAKYHARNEESDREVDKDHMLRVLGEQRGFWVEGVEEDH